MKNPLIRRNIEQIASWQQGGLPWVLLFLSRTRVFGAMRYYRLGMPEVTFDILRDFLHLESLFGDSTGSMAADVLLVKIANAQVVFQRQRTEWGRSTEPPLKILDTPAVRQDTIAFCLEELKRIALYARQCDTGIQWS